MLSETHLIRWRQALPLLVITITCLLVVLAAAAGAPLHVTSAFTGSSAALGMDMRSGLLTAFQMADARAGTALYIDLVSLDNALDRDHQHGSSGAGERFRFGGQRGHTTAQVIVPVATAARIPLVGALTGARFLRTPYTPYAINVRASYDDEVADFVTYAKARASLPS